MLTYFALQFRMINRKLIAFGVPPILAYPAFIFGFIWGSDYLFSKDDFGKYAYILLVFWLLLKLTDKKRNQFLRLCYSRFGYIKIRLLENLLITLSFALYLIYNQYFTLLIYVLLLAIILVFVQINVQANFSIPTPFYKKPFEFIVGFRTSIVFFLIAYALTIISIVVQNMNLGIFAMLLIFLVAMSFYSKLEKHYFIWTYNLTAKEFLIEKLQTGTKQAAILSMPICIALLFFFSSEWQIIMSFMVLGFLYLAAVITGKYSIYPHEMNIPQGVLIGLSLLFPPLVIGLIFYFFIQAKKRLIQTIL